MDRRLGALAPALLYRTLGPALPAGLAEGAVMLGIALQAVSQAPEPIARAGFSGPPLAAAASLFQAILKALGPGLRRGPLGRRPGSRGDADGRIELALDDLLANLQDLEAGPGAGDEDLPFVLSAGERRSFTANTIFRAKEWRKKDAGARSA